MQYNAIQCKTMKAVTVRLEDEQAERLEHLKGELKNTDAGVLRFALDLLFRTVTQKESVPVDGAKPEATAA